jgi:hypothetical protein
MRLVARRWRKWCRKAILGEKGYDVFVSDFGKIKTSTNKFLQIMVSTGRMKTY